MSSKNNPTEKPDDEADQRRRERALDLRDAGGLLNFLNPFGDGFLGIGWGGIMIALVALPLVYMAAKNDKIQGWIGQFFDGDQPGSGKAKIQEMMNGLEAWIEGASGGKLFSGASARLVAGLDAPTAHTHIAEKFGTAIADVIAPDAQGWDKFKTLALQANGGKITGADDFMNARVMVALITQQPELTKRLLQAAQQNSDGKSAGAMQQINSQLASIIGGEGLNILLAPQNRANTLSVLRTIKPEISGSESLILTLLDNPTYMKDGQATDDLRTFIADALNGKSLQNSPALQAAQGAVLASIGTPGAQSPAMFAPLLGAANAPAATALQQALGNRFATLLKLVSSHDSNGVITFAGDPKNTQAVKTFLNALQFEALPDSIDGATRKNLEGLRDALNHPQKLQMADVAVRSGVQLDDPLTTKMMGALSQLGTSGGMKSLLELDAGDVTQFFSDKSRVKVLKNMLYNLPEGAIAPKLLASLKHRFDALASVLADPQAVKSLKGIMRSADNVENGEISLTSAKLALTAFRAGNHAALGQMIDGSNSPVLKAHKQEIVDLMFDAEHAVDSPSQSTPLQNAAQKTLRGAKEAAEDAVYDLKRSVQMGVRTSGLDNLGSMIVNLPLIGSNTQERGGA